MFVSAQHNQKSHINSANEKKKQNVRRQYKVRDFAIKTDNKLHNDLSRISGEFITLFSVLTLTQLRSTFTFIITYTHFHSLERASCGGAS